MMSCPSTAYPARLMALLPAVCAPAPGARLLPGVALSAVLAASASGVVLLPGIREHGLGALTLALVLGMVVGNTVYPRLAAASAPGVTLCRQCLLRLGVVLFGLRLTWQDLARVGVAGVAVDALVLGSTFLLAWYVGVRWLRLDRKTALLIAAGNSICGAAAVMAAEPIVRARTEHVAVAVATVVIFGTLAVFLYPFLYTINARWPLIAGGTAGLGIYAGSTVHEVAQVIAAAHPLGDAAVRSAVVAKMVRVMMLAPVLLGMSWLIARRTAPAGGDHRAARVQVPWFAFAFIAATGIASLPLIPASSSAVLARFDGFVLAMAMAALGLGTQLSALRLAGLRPLLLGLILFVWLVTGGAAINHWLAPAR